MRKSSALAFVLGFILVQPFAWPESVLPASYQPALQGRVHTVTIPAETVMNIVLSAPINSRSARVGDPITAAVKDPVYVGPFLAVPVGSIISGRVSDVNRLARQNGPNPYIVVDFTRLNRPGDKAPIAINAALIAYKTGLQREDYLWKLPQTKDKLKDRLGSAVEGAAVGFFANPILGPIIGAGAGVLKSVAIDKIASRGNIKVKTGEEIPIAVQDAFKVPISGKAPDPAAPHAWLTSSW